MPSGSADLPSHEPPTVPDPEPAFDFSRLRWQDTTTAMRREMRRRGIPRPKQPRRRAGARRDARRIYDLEMRDHILRRTREGAGPAEVARELRQTVAEIERYRRDAVAASTERRVRAVRMTPGVDPDAGHPKRIARKAVPPPPGPCEPSRVVDGVILDAPDVVELKRDCLRLRKAMLEYDEIAARLEISESMARRYTAEALSSLERSENLGADLERRLMLEQVDQMIAAIHPISTGKALDGSPRPVMLDAIDRMLKLLKQKADLLGIGTPPAVDLRIRLQALAADGGYDIVDLEDLAREVISAHKVKVPEFR
jgi:hypothetical protein